MSGHSKWSTIKHQKGTADAKRGMLFTKLANAITIAVRNNRGVSLAVDKAKAANMPKDNIQRAIDRATQSSSGDLSEATFEGFGPENVAIIIEAITDNVTRTAQEVRNFFTKNGGVLGTTSYFFTRLGEIEVEGENIFEKALEAGAEDVEANFVYTKPEQLHLVREKLASGLKIISAQLIFKPKKESLISVSDPEKLTAFLSLLEDLDDIQNVYCNANMS